MFLALPCTAEQMAQLRDRYAIHGLPGGRINLAGLPSTRIGDLATGLTDVLAAS
jgi:aspartate aminotransferase/aromatic-amino-acid transaminase